MYKPIRLLIWYMIRKFKADALALVLGLLDQASSFHGL